MKNNVANKDINGWSVIYKWLTIKGKRQSDLAILLNVTASAISQIKSGNILLNATQISLILDYLQIDSRDMCALYTLIFNARLNGKVCNALNGEQKLVVHIADTGMETGFTVSSEVKDPASEYEGAFRRVPLMTFKQAMDYEPALESIESFARYCSDKTVTFPGAQSGSFALLVDHNETASEFAHSAVLLISGREYPSDGDMVVAKLRSGEVITKYYIRQENVIHLESKNPDADSFVWHYKDDPGYIQWMYPIIEVNLKLRAENYTLSE
ncbi:MAG: S24 family peptidase [Victivallales bacterium]